MRFSIDDTDMEYTDIFIQLNSQELLLIEEDGAICFPWQNETEFSKKVYLTIRKDYMKESQKAAMKHPDKLGAGAAKRKELPPKDKKEVVMKEFQKGTLHSGSGEKVTNPKQAVAIAYSEAGESKKKK